MVYGIHMYIVDIADDKFDVHKFYSYLNYSKNLSAAAKKVCPKRIASAMTFAGRQASLPRCIQPLRLTAITLWLTKVAATEDAP